jgi:pimeloyl-ACP methyl ester carboxylesterase
MRMASILASLLTSSAVLLSGCSVAPCIDAVREATGTAPLASGASIHQLEPYDPARIPVLFVHGIGGSPRDFRPMLDALDRERFQAWVFQYPTDLRLHLAAHDLGRLLAKLQFEHRFASLIIVAHSMGGLVARRYLIDALDAGDPGFARVLVTISSPWSGNDWAALGARLVPDPPGPWIDLAPGSAFLVSLSYPLPQVPHYVFFGYRRAPSLLTSQSSDGAITLESQIPEWIQQQAARSWGFDADHAGILSSGPALGRLNALLALEAGRMRSGGSAKASPR